MSSKAARDHGRAIRVLQTLGILTACLQVTHGSENALELNESANETNIKNVPHAVKQCYK
jgi:hypothetical protein